MADLVDLADLGPVLDAADIRYDPSDNFETIYEAIASDPTRAATARHLEERLRDYFEAVRIPDHATFYDRLLLSLRSKDVIASFNWDPLLPQAYKRNRHVATLPRILFLHGNVDVGVCVDHLQKGFLEHSCPNCEKGLKPVPLLYPVSQKDYVSDPFIRTEWEELRTALEDAYLLTIVGYAAPNSDQAAKNIMLEAWHSNRSRELAEVEIVDIKGREELESTWSPFFVRTHYGVSREPSLLYHHPRRSCDHFAMATLQQRPCRDNPLLMTEDLAALQSWVLPLVAQENALKEEGTPFPC